MFIILLLFRGTFSAVLDEFKCGHVESENRRKEGRKLRRASRNRLQNNPLFEVRSISLFIVYSQSSMLRGTKISHNYKEDESVGVS